uniref:Biogenic amine-like GPCR n=1 Tax=Tripedalia cystophora TaxID=6141 RepID=A0A481ZQG2_TRICY|nr:biogenic amine-like GPCR [Tripedalia cystophora]
MPDAAVVTVLVLLGTGVLILNGFCLLVIGFAPSIRRPSVTAVGSLLFTHLLQGLVVIPSYIMKRWKLESSVASTLSCDVFRFSYMLTNYSSCLTLLVIAVDRLIATWKPLNYTLIVTKKRILCVLALVWAYVIVLCSIPFIPLDVKTKCHYNPSKLWTAGMLIGNTLLPSLIISFCYIFIFKVAVKIIRRRQVNKKPNDGSNKKVNFGSGTSLRELAAAKMSLIIVIGYYICWGPSFFYYLILTFCPQCFAKDFWDSDTEQWLGFVIKAMTFIDGFTAPLVYCFKHSGFRIAFRKLKRRIKRSRMVSESYTDPLTSTVSESNL